jgi:hypothetical protein
VVHPRLVGCANVTYAHPFATRKGPMRQVKLRSEPRCEACLRERRVTEAVTVHHIKPINEGGDPSAWDNLESRLRRAHKRIRAATVRHGFQEPTFDFAGRFCDVTSRILIKGS